MYHEGTPGYVKVALHFGGEATDFPWENLPLWRRSICVFFACMRAIKKGPEVAFGALGIHEGGVD